ncbi:MAG: DUF3426 domain-containing protein [Caulobacter sp.]|nr:DUF3426 domain-containing protein [Caulobacter sp.]
MILTCPDCATRYFVPDDKVGPDGRTVKCSSCGNRWTAHNEPELELFVGSEEGATVREPTEAVEDAKPVSALPGEELPKVFRQKADTSRRVREAATTGIVWAGMAVALVGMVATAVIFRVNVVKIWPASAAAYAGVGLAVNPLGLTIEDVRAEAALQDGHAALAVSGVIRNVEAKAATAPPLRVSLINKSGKVVAVQLAAPADPKIPPGGVRHFVITLLDPPTTAADLEVTFDLTHQPPAVKAKAPKPKPTEASRLALHGATAPTPVPHDVPVDAHALPESSPYALPKEGH